jgi:hypothetical protein
MQRLLKLRKDYYSCLLLLIIGGGAVGLGLTYQFGALNQMGAGFVPVVMGFLLMAVALAIGITAEPPKPIGTDSLNTHGLKPAKPEWRGWLCIVGGIVAFIAFGKYGGMVPASFFCVFISAMGDRDNTVKGATLLAAAITAFGVAVFYYGLHLQLPLFAWGN